MVWSNQSSRIAIPSNCQMVEMAGPTAVGSNQVTQLVDPSANTNGLVIYSFYTQVIQSEMPGDSAQSLVLAAATAPTSFVSKSNCFALYRTFQNEKQDLVALGGFAPMAVMHIEIPSGWGIWQVVTVAGQALSRNNMRLSLAYI